MLDCCSLAVVSLVGGFFSVVFRRWDFLPRVEIKTVDMQSYSGLMRKQCHITACVMSCYQFWRVQWLLWKSEVAPPPGSWWSPPAPLSLQLGGTHSPSCTWPAPEPICCRNSWKIIQKAGINQLIFVLCVWQIHWLVVMLRNKSDNVEISHIVDIHSDGTCHSPALWMVAAEERDLQPEFLRSAVGTSWWHTLIKGLKDNIHMINNNLGHTNVPCNEDGEV